MKYKCIQQFDSSDCASACIASISWFFGNKVSEIQLREKLKTDRNGTSVYNICKISEELGLQATAYKRTDNLDEATSNIDAKSERQILNYINSLEPLTVIMISHHLRTPEKYNRIYIMENGSIIDSGTHNELINTSKIYQSYSRMEGKI